MKARELQKLLGTDRTIHATKERICIASLYCHDLISLNVNTFKVKYALGGRSQDAEIRQLINGLQSLKQSEIEYYWQGVDVIENPITLFYLGDDDKIKTAITDSLNFPSVTDDGILIYENTHFKTKEECISYQLNNVELGIKYGKEYVVTKESELAEAKANLVKYQVTAEMLRLAKKDLNHAH